MIMQNELLNEIKELLEDLTPILEDFDFYYLNKCVPTKEEVDASNLIYMRLLRMRDTLDKLSPTQGGGADE
jgi:hypothetical protein